MSNTIEIKMKEIIFELEKYKYIRLQTTHENIVNDDSGDDDDERTTANQQIIMKVNTTTAVRAGVYVCVITNQLYIKTQIRECVGDSGMLFGLLLPTTYYVVVYSDISSHFSVATFIWVCITQCFSVLRVSLNQKNTELYTAI